MPYDVNEIRRKIKESKGRAADPDEFRPPKIANDTDTKSYRFFVLPHIQKGDVLKSGTVKKSMDNYCITHGNHWHNNKPHPCPRIWDGSDCPICTFGFDLLREETNKEKRTAIVKSWMPNAAYMVNIFFTTWTGNPEDVRGKVKFFNASKTCYDSWNEAIMRESCGDAEDPQAYGTIFDENNAFLFQLEIKKQGQNNSYKTSKFIANGGVPRPFVVGKDGQAHREAIDAILKMRINLWDKIDVPDAEKMKRLAAVLIEGDDSADGAADDAGFDSDEEAANVKTQKPAAAKAAKTQSESKPASSSPLDKEVPLHESVSEPVEPPKKEKPTAKPAKAAPATTPAPSDADDDDADLMSLLGKLTAED